MKNKGLITGIAAISCVAMLAGCSSEEKKGVGIDLANFDTSVSPSSDFFHYANGGWIKSNPIPSDQSRLGLIHNPRRK